MDLSQMLGQRMVEAARLMVAAHLHASLDEVRHFRQQIVIGQDGPSPSPAKGELSNEAANLRILERNRKAEG